MKIKKIFVFIYVLSFVFLISCNKNNVLIDEKAQQEIASEYLHSKYSDDFAFLSAQEGDLTKLTYSSTLGEFIVNLDKTTNTMTDNYLSLYYKQEAQVFFSERVKAVYGENAKVVVDTSDVFGSINSFSAPKNLEDYLFYANVIDLKIFTKSSFENKDEDIKNFQQKIRKDKVRISANVYYLSNYEFENFDYSTFSKNPDGYFKTDLDLNFSDYIWY